MMNYEDLELYALDEEMNLGDPEEQVDPGKDIAPRSGCSPFILLIIVLLTIIFQLEWLTK